MLAELAARTLRPCSLGASLESPLSGRSSATEEETPRLIEPRRHGHFVHNHVAGAFDEAPEKHAAALWCAPAQLPMRSKGANNFRTKHDHAAGGTIKE